MSKGIVRYCDVADRCAGFVGFESFEVECEGMCENKLPVAPVTHDDEVKVSTAGKWWHTNASCVEHCTTTEMLPAEHHRQVK